MQSFAVSRIPAGSCGLLPRREKITADEIQEWVDSECALAYAVQAANWHTPDMQQPPLPAQLPFHTPKILRVKKVKREGINWCMKSKNQNETLLKFNAALLLGAVGLLRQHRG